MSLFDFTSRISMPGSLTTGSNVRRGLRVSLSFPQVKSSVGMLKVFCQFLHGEGDFVRHLKKMGYVVGHVQSYIGKGLRELGGGAAHGEETMVNEFRSW